MKARFISNTLACAIAGVCALQSQALHADEQIEEELVIIGMREQRQSKGATGLDLSVFDTPQSVSVLNQELLSSFALNDINSTLEMVTGVNVEAIETDRTYYNARGFDITSMHVDGVGIPFDGLVQGDIDTAVYQKVEVIRGANGLITGIGNPSGTINYVRKRPTNELMVDTKATLGSWAKKRVQLDASVPLTGDSRWAARAVVVAEDKQSWLDHYQSKRNVLYGIIDGQIGSAITLAAGYTHHNNESDGVLWGAVPLMYSDGTQTDFDVSTTTTQKWTYWNATTDTAFVELGWKMAADWNLTTTYTHTRFDEPSELFYIYNSGDGYSSETGLGINSWPGRYHAESQAAQWDTVVDGAFSAWGQQHQLIVGLSIAEKTSETLDWTALTGFQAMPAFPGWTGEEVERPEWGDSTRAADIQIDLNRLYTVVRLSLSDSFKLMLGGNALSYQNSGESWDVSTNSEEDGSSPYLGFTWEIVSGLNAYASYSDIYQPQFELGEDFQPLGSAKGTSSELGVKKHWLGNRLLTNVALFKTEQQNLAEFAGYSDGDNIDDDDFSDDFDWALYRGIEAESEGFELEVVGEISDNFGLQAGYTQLELKDPEGQQSRTFIPRKTLKLLAEWQPVSRLQLGLSGRWQSDIYYDGEYGRITQGSYFLLGGYASYDVTEQLNLSLNLKNLGDKKYLGSLQWEQSYYGEPRAAYLSLRWKI